MYLFQSTYSYANFEIFSPTKNDPQSARSEFFYSIEKPLAPNYLRHTNPVERWEVPLSLQQ